MSDAVGVFDVAQTGDDERRLAKIAYDDKIAAATYDVRQKFGDWLFGAESKQAFRDRFSMSHNDIARTIEPHIHAGVGVITRVSKKLLAEWHQRKAGEDGAYDRDQDHPEQHIQKTFQDHQGEDLIPEKSWQSYRDRVDQGGPEKVESHAFIPGEHDKDYSHSDEGRDFVPKVTGSRELQYLSRLLVADDLTGMDPNAQGTGGDMSAPSIPAAPAPSPAPMSDPSGPMTSTPPAGSPMAAPPPPGGPPPVTASREYLAMRRMLADSGVGDYDSAMQLPGITPQSPGVADPTSGLLGETAMPGQHPMGAPGGKGGVGTTPAFAGPNDGAGGPRAVASLSPEQRQLQAMLRQSSILTASVANKVAGRMVHASVPARLLISAALQGDHAMLRTADRNYLQQADEAITKVLNEKAEEFQNTIAPLQQALVTIQQAEQLQNPLNVQPPAGTVNVLPQGSQGNPAPGGDPSGGQAPQGAGGLGADPAAAALAGGGQQPQQVAASRRRAYYDDEGSDEFQPRQQESPWQEVAPGWHQDLSSPSESYHHQNGRSYVAPLSNGQGWKAQHSPHPDDYSAPLPSREHAMAVIEQGHPATGWTGGRTGSRRPFVRKAEAVEQEYANFLKKQPGLPTSGGVGVQEFAQQKKVGPRALQKLKTKQGLPPEMPVPGAGSDISANQGGKRQRRRQTPKKASGTEFVEPGYTWSKSPQTVSSEFGDRVASGTDPEKAFREMIAEIAQHHKEGQIGSHDAHRAANEALGRLMLARKRRAAGLDPRGRRPLGAAR